MVTLYIYLDIPGLPYRYYLVRDVKAFGSDESSRFVAEAIHDAHEDHTGELIGQQVAVLVHRKEVTMLTPVQISKSVVYFTSSHTTERGKFHLSAWRL